MCKIEEYCFNISSTLPSPPIFWHVFEELSDQGNELVNYDKLQERLISTGKFYASDAFMMIEHMEKSGEIEQTGDYHVYRKKLARLQ
jgi:hypothetical protein